jgi:hypothetical protein
MLLVTIFQKYRLRSVFPSLQFFNLGQVLASSSLQSSNSEEARAFPSLMAPPPMHRCWTINSISEKMLGQYLFNWWAIAQWRHPGYATGDTIDYVGESISTKLKIIFSRGAAIISNNITDEFYIKRKLVENEI